ncbi:MAG: hypothetical protein ACTSQG_06325 [Promethearchaeota archaeon]
MVKKEIKGYCPFKILFDGTTNEGIKINFKDNDTGLIGFIPVFKNKKSMFEMYKRDIKYFSIKIEGGVNDK